MFSEAIIRDIKLEHLNTKCLIQISKFARQLHRINGTVLKLQDKNIIQEIMFHNRINDNLDLNVTYELLKAEIKHIVINTELERSLIQSSSGYSIQPKQQILN